MYFTSADSEIFYELRNWDAPSLEIPLLFLHSALGTHMEFDTLSSFYPNRKQILLDFPAHGQSTTYRSEFSAKFLARSVLDLLEELKIYSVDIIGYSMGGYVALELAKKAPRVVKSIVSHAMKFYWTEEEIVKSLAQLDMHAIKARSERVFNILYQTHLTNGLDKTIEANRSIIKSFRNEKLAEKDLQDSKIPLLLSVGDRDELITLPEIVKLFQSQDPKKTYLAIHPHSPHSISKLDLSSFTHSVREFWKTVESVIS